MAKFSGIIGYAEKKETVAGIWSDDIVEKNYTGDVFRMTKRLQGTDNVSDDLVINNLISIVSDPYAVLNYFKIKYVIYNGAKWKVTNVEVQRPRLILTLGGVYNGN